MKKIIKGVTWLKILILSITTQVRYIMVSVRHRLAVAFRAKPNQNQVRGSLPVTGLNRIKGLALGCTKSAPKTFIYCLKTGAGGSFWTGTTPNTSAATTGPMLSLTDTTFFLITN